MISKQERLGQTIAELVHKTGQTTNKLAGARTSFRGLEVERDKVYEVFDQVATHNQFCTMLQNYIVKAGMDQRGEQLQPARARRVRAPEPERQRGQQVREQRCRARRVERRHRTRDLGGMRGDVRADVGEV